MSPRPDPRTQAADLRLGLRLALFGAGRLDPLALSRAAQDAAMPNGFPVGGLTAPQMRALPLPLPPPHLVATLRRLIRHLRR